MRLVGWRQQSLWDCRTARLAVVPRRSGFARSIRAALAWVVHTSDDRLTGRSRRGQSARSFRGEASADCRRRLLDTKYSSQDRPHAPPPGQLCGDGRPLGCRLPSKYSNRVIAVSKLFAAKPAPTAVGGYSSTKYSSQARPDVPPPGQPCGDGGPLGCRLPSKILQSGDCGWQAEVLGSRASYRLPSRRRQAVRTKDSPKSA